MSRLPPMKCKPHGIPECRICKNPKPHGPVSPHFMDHYYGAAKPAPVSDDTALLRQALEALEDANTFTGAWPTGAKVITDIRTRLGETK